MTIDGIGADFVALEQKGEAIVPEEFVRWYHTESRGNKLIDHLETQFQQCDVIEHYSNSWKMKVSRDSYSIGYLFGMMEDVQDQYEVSEYQVA